MERVLGDGCLGGHPPTFVPAAHANSGWRLSERCRNAKWLESTGESQLAQPAARREKLKPVGQWDSHGPASYYQDRQFIAGGLPATGHFDQICGQISCYSAQLSTKNTAHSAVFFCNM